MQAPSFADSDLPAERHCAVFDTAIGPCGIAWRDEAVTLVMLTLLDREATLEELRWQSNSEVAPPPWPPFVTQAVAALQALLAGKPLDDEEAGTSPGTEDAGARFGTLQSQLQQVPLDWAGIGDFERKVYEATRRVAVSTTCTYDELARAMNQPGAARAVDVALARNPWPLIVPCHRVLAGHGKLGGYSAPGGVATKRRLLDIEAAMLRQAQARRVPR